MHWPYCLLVMRGAMLQTSGLRTRWAGQGSGTPGAKSFPRRAQHVLLSQCVPTPECRPWVSLPEIDRLPTDPCEQEGRGETLHLLPQATCTCQVAEAWEGRCPLRLRLRTHSAFHIPGLALGGRPSDRAGTLLCTPKPLSFMWQFK